MYTHCGKDVTAFVEVNAKGCPMCGKPFSELSVETQEEIKVTGAPGSTQSRTITLVAEGCIDRPIDYTVSASDAWIGISEQAGSMLPGEQREVQLQIKVPSTDINRGTIQVSSFALNDDKPVAIAVTASTARPIFKCDVKEIQLEEGGPPTEIVATNDGTVELTGHADTENPMVQVNPEHFRIAPGESQTFHLSVDNWGALGENQQSDTLSLTTDGGDRTIVIELVRGVDEDDLWVGIDFGTTNSAVGILRGLEPSILQGEHGRKLMPSIVSLRSVKGRLERHVGFEARNNLGYPDTPEWISFREVKRHLKESELFPVTIGGVEYDAIEIGAMIVRRLLDRAEDHIASDEEITGAVITVPHGWDDSQREATEEIGRRAGLKEVRLLSEPVAAAKSLTETSASGNGIYLVVDWGGGTLDVALLKRASEDGRVNFKVLPGTDGDPELGGLDVDEALAELLVKELDDARTGGRGWTLPYLAENAKYAHNQILEKAEEMKKRLSTNSEGGEVAMEYIDISHLPDGEDTISLSEWRVTVREFEDVAGPIVDRILPPIERALMHLKNPDDESEIEEIEAAEDKGGRTAAAAVLAQKIRGVQLVGGSCRIPMVRERLERYFEADRIIQDADIDKAVVHGATREASRVIDREEPDGNGDCTRYAYGIPSEDHRFASILPQYQEFPCSRTETFHTKRDNLKKLRIHILQCLTASYDGGRAITGREFRLVKTFEVMLPKRTPFNTPVYVTFSVDRNGVMQATAECRGKRMTTTVLG